MPSGIPARGWRDILLRVKAEMADDQVSFLSAGVAFYLFLALVPLLTLLVSLYSLTTAPWEVSSQVESLRGIVPAGVLDVIRTELERLSSSDEAAAGWGVLVGVAGALWASSKGTEAVITGLNVVYDEREERGWIKRKLVTLAITGGAALLVILAGVVVVGTPALIEGVGLGWLGPVVRWPLVVLMVMIGASLLYRWAPARRSAKWSWLSWGAALCGIVWGAASAGLVLYLENFGDYGKTYGSLGVVVLLLTWFYLGAFAVLLGGELNAEMEHQTERDTTKGKPKPMGERGAYVADTVGEIPD